MAVDAEVAEFVDDNVVNTLGRGSNELRVQNDFGGSVMAQIPSAGFIKDAERAIAAADGPLLYARVDGIEVANQLCVVELELIEPALFLANSDSAPARLAEVISRFVG